MLYLYSRQWRTGHPKGCLLKRACRTIIKKAVQKKYLRHDKRHQFMSKYVMMRCASESRLQDITPLCSP